ncbi:hypothetical protein C7974DRAFT_374627 [Boeremia exigua]|uniref:uncharacterized protein n=1 Tax=Boeremia exigua TaxID=749465 RepID=UPI001E8CB21B|nr:uncharacterized protein C7974DRAFT_374627 [Boeremia exigua]KAH6638022.1 hypothetical protein C7974DRAFT_374627 [Boeremia exigua]
MKLLCRGRVLISAFLAYHLCMVVESTTLQPGQVVQFTVPKLKGITGRPLGTSCAYHEKQDTQLYEWLLDTLFFAVYWTRAGVPVKSFFVCDDWMLRSRVPNIGWSGCSTTTSVYFVHVKTFCLVIMTMPYICRRCAGGRLANAQCRSFVIRVEKSDLHITTSPLSMCTLTAYVYLRSDSPTSTLRYLEDGVEACGGASGEDVPTAQIAVTQQCRAQAGTIPTTATAATFLYTLIVGWIAAHTTK